MNMNMRVGVIILVKRFCVHTFNPFGHDFGTCYSIFILYTVLSVSAFSLRL